MSFLLKALNCDTRAKAEEGLRKARVFWEEMDERLRKMEESEQGAKFLMGTEVARKGTEGGSDLIIA